MSLFESHSSEPTEEELIRIEEDVKEETRGSFFNSYEHLTPEEKKAKILERWSAGRARFGGDFQSGRAAGEAFAEIAGNVIGASTEVLGGLLSRVAAESARKSAEVIAEVGDRQRVFNERRQASRQMLLSRTIKSMMDPHAHVGVPPRRASEEDTLTTDPREVETNNEQGDTSPTSVYLENDTVTLPRIEMNEDIQNRCGGVAEQLNVIARDESAVLIEEDPELASDRKDFYENVARMTERGDVDAALRFLDGNLGGGESNVWNDEARGAAIALGDMKRELTGQNPADFDDVSYAMQKNAAGLAENGVPEDIDSGAELLAMLDRMNEPGEYGVKATEEVLDYSERILAFRTEMLNKKLNEHAEGGSQREGVSESEFGAKFWRREVEEAQRMRDAAFQELQKKKSEVGTPPASDPIEEGSATVAVDGSAEQQITDEQIADVRKKIDLLFTGKEDISTHDVSTEKFPIELSRKEQEQEAFEFPLDYRALVAFEKEKLAPHKNDSEEEFAKWFTPDQEERLRGFLKAKIKMIINGRRPGMTSPDNIASVWDNGGGPYIQQIMRAKGSPMLSTAESLNMSFSNFAKEYLDMDVRDVEPNYASYFSARDGSLPEVYGK